MTTYVGIHCGHCASVAVVRDNRVIFAQSEERFAGLKNAAGFPTKTLEYVYTNVAPPDQIAGVAFNAANPNFNFAPFIEKAGNRLFDPHYYLRNRLGIPGSAPLMSPVAAARQLQSDKIEEEDLRRYDSDPENIARSLDYFQSATQMDGSRIQFIDHHLCHAYSAHPALFDRSDALVFTLDGYGDDYSSTVTLFSEGEHKLLSSTPRLVSLGKFYKAVTGILGMKCGEHEHKVMGLAPYGLNDQSRDLSLELENMISITDKGTWKCSWESFNDLLIQLEIRLRFQRFDTVAAALQLLAERLVSRWIHYWIVQTGSSTVGLAGGVFMNVKVNKKIHELPSVKDLYVVPSAGDESTPIGAALYLGRTSSETRIIPLESVYLGSRYSEAEIVSTIESASMSNRFRITKSQCIGDEVAELLARGEIVARFAGAMEFGARALGNRSILADPSRSDTVSKINGLIKNRDFWMPFAPSILDTDIERYCVNPKRLDSPFMMLAFESTPSARVDLRAAVHPSDGSLRGHFVKRASNPDFYDLITRFKELSKIGAVLNTSFNLHGSPIVQSPADALITFERMQLRFLALDEYLIEKLD